MTTKHQQFEEARELLAAAWQRAREILPNDNCVNPPTKPGLARLLVALELTIAADSLVAKGAEALALEPTELGTPVSEERCAELQEHYEEPETVSAEEAFAARIAIAHRLAAAASNLIQQAEDYLERRQALQG